jgi:hypothetical protein
VTWVMANLVSVRLETVLVSVQYRCMVCTKCTIGPVIIFGHTRLHSKVTRHKWNLVSVQLEIVLILMQDRCIVYAERTIDSAIILDTPDETPR